MTCLKTIAVRVGVPHVARLPLGESESFSDHRGGQFDPSLHVSTCKSVLDMDAELLDSS